MLDHNNIEVLNVPPSRLTAFVNMVIPGAVAGVLGATTAERLGSSNKVEFAVGVIAGMAGAGVGVHRVYGPQHVVSRHAPSNSLGR